MKLIVEKEPYLTKNQKFKLLVLLNALILTMFIVASIFSMCGSKAFIVNYSNDRLNEIYLWLTERNIYPLIAYIFSTIEFYIISWFILDRRPSIIYCLIFYSIPITISLITDAIPSIIWSLYPFLFYFLMPIIEHYIHDRHSDFTFKIYFKKYILRIIISVAICYLYQFLIYMFKTGIVSYENNVFNLELTFIYNLEYYIALITAFYFISLCFKGKGDNEKWETCQQVGSYSLTSNKKSQKSSLSQAKKNELTKAQQQKLRLLHLKVLIFQSLGFLILMILPFLLGRVFEFLVMYFSFAMARALLGFKYSLHFKKESTCIFVGVVVFAIITLVVPFFYVNSILGIIIGVLLAIILHFSYKYKGMWFFQHISNKDRFAEFYTIFDGNIEYQHIVIMANHYGVKDKNDRNLLADYMKSFKLSYLSKKYNYSIRQINNKLDNMLELIKAKL